MQSKLYVLEVVKFITAKESNSGCKQQHVGYMKLKFKSKDDAHFYYDKHNPHMRKINAFGTSESDWDPYTTLKYIVREDYTLIETIEPFSIFVENKVF